MSADELIHEILELRQGVALCQSAGTRVDEQLERMNHTARGLRARLDSRRTAARVMAFEVTSAELELSHTVDNKVSAETLRLTNVYVPIIRSLTADIEHNRAVLRSLSAPPPSHL